jgi:hypothetical protein
MSFPCPGSPSGPGRSYWRAVLDQVPDPPPYSWQAEGMAHAKSGIGAAALPFAAVLMSIAISIAALAVSLSAFLSTRWRDRRDLMLRVHERLVTRDQQRGRRLVFEMSEKKTQVEDLSADDYELINSALAALDVLVIYYKRRYIRRKDVLEIWAAQVLRVVRAAQPS